MMESDFSSTVLVGFTMILLVGLGIFGWYQFSLEQQFLDACRDAGGVPVIAHYTKTCFSVNAIVDLK